MKTHFQPELIATDCFIAKNAALRGEVIIGSHSCVLFGAVIRETNAADAEMIRHGWEHYVETSQQYKATES